MNVQSADALALAIAILATKSARLKISDGLELTLNRTKFERDVNLAISDAAEFLVPARRGRPRGSRTGG